jgi:hypothetical protein
MPATKSCRPGYGSIEQKEFVPRYWLRFCNTQVICNTQNQLKNAITKGVSIFWDYGHHTSAAVMLHTGIAAFAEINRLFNVSSGAASKVIVKVFPLAALAFSAILLAQGGSADL